MRKFYILLIGLIMLFSLSSCETYMYATTQDDIYVETEADIVRSNVSFDVVIRYGTPYYHDGILLYYIYNNLFYYPYYYNNYWYVRAYRRPFPHVSYRPYFRPHRYDYRFNPGQYRGFDKRDPRRHNHSVYSPKPHRPNNHINRPPQNRHSSSRIDRNQNNHSGHRNMGNRR